MSKTLVLAACLSVLGAGIATAGGKAPFPMAADGTTNVADCAKVDAAWHNECLSRARPVTGKQIYAAITAPKAAATVTAPVVKAKLAAPAAVAGAPKGFKIAKDGTTDINDCVKARIDVRDACISRSRPLNAKQLAKFERRQAALGKVAAKRAPKTVAVAKVAAPAVAPVVIAKAPALLGGKGFKIAKDGTTNIADCSSAVAEFRNECISRARPVMGAEIYKVAKTKS